MGKRPFYRKVRQTLHETVSDSGKSVLCYRGNNDKIYYVASSDDPNVEPGGGMIEVTWQELKNKRDAGELIPGCLYRITDYQCTTTQENTKSAGHQFDIVLLALSENKLAEEGWAMMHDNDVYDVTFVDGVTKRCWIYILNDTDCNIIDVDTLLGIDAEELSCVSIDEINKTAIDSVSNSDSLENPNLTYNYFQNSNLSAWKVWYCLDNDKSRFAWADDSVDESTPAFLTNNGVNYYRDVLHDSEGSRFPYAWTSSENVTKYTLVLEPSGRVAFVNNPNETPPFGVVTVTYTPAHEGTGLPNGRGVIYRLIDEWGNDVPYDFKNIMLSVGMGKDEYGYLFSRSNYIGDEDYSINGAFVNVSIAQYPTYTGGEGEFINSIELGILAPSLRTGERLQDIKIASGYLTSNEQIDQLSSHSIMGYSIESSKESSKT